MKKTRWISSLLIYKLAVPYANAMHCMPVRSVQATPIQTLEVWLSDEKGGEVPGYPDAVPVPVEQIGEPVNDKPECDPGGEWTQ